MAAFVKKQSLEVTRHHFEIGACVGQGANANVYRSKMSGKICAVKMLRTDTERRNQKFQDMLMEIFVMSSMGSHPSLIEFYGACLSEVGNPIVLMEWIEGQDLESYLMQQPIGFALDTSIVYAWSHNLLSALDFLHDRDPIIIHRDIKPANLLLAHDHASLKLADLGLAKTVARAARSSALHRSNTGTPRYRAPEVHTQRAVHTQRTAHSTHNTQHTAHSTQRKAGAPIDG